MKPASAARRVVDILAALALAVYFFRLSRGSLHGFLSPDDITNLYRSCSHPLGLLVRANLLFYEASAFYRPLPSAWYRVTFHFAGLNPLPYHAMNLLILGANMFLTYAVARGLSGSRETGWLATLFASYHRQFNGLYFDTAFIFDVLCYFFYLCTFLIYMRRRDQARFLGGWLLAPWCALYICALNSKEMAVTLPLTLGIYEALYHPPTAWRLSELWRWLREEGRGMLVAGGMALVFALGRTLGALSLARMSAYQPVFTWERFMATNRQFLGDLFFLVNRFTPTTVLLVWAVMAALAWATKSRQLRFAWLFLMISMAPVAFIEPRGAAQYYIPLFGWALYLGAALAELGAWLSGRIPGIAGQWAARLWGPALLTALLLLFYPYYKSMGWDNVASVRVDGEMVRSLSAQIQAMHPTMTQGARLLLLNEADDPVWEDFVKIVRLSYRDHDIRVDRARKMNRKIEDTEAATYDHILAYREGRLVEVQRTTDPRLAPRIVETPDGPEIYHTDWSPLTGRNPARQGEVLIVKAKGLGATLPDVGSGKAFPAEPLVPVLSSVAARLNGLKMDVINAIGWPQSIDTYRVDCRIPNGIKGGQGTLELCVRGLSAPPVRIPVR
jgi:hypothetical protein